MKAPSVFIVDDEQDIRDLLRIVIEGLGYNVVGEASNGKRALELLKELNYKVDILLLDIIMPGKSGLDVLKDLQDKKNDICILMLTASKDTDSIKTSINSGASYYIIKNNSPDKIMELIKTSWGSFSFKNKLKNQQLRFLVVDDSSFNRLVIKQIITRLGHEVIGEAGNGYEAIELAETLLPDIITMDLSMPECDGLTATKKILEKNSNNNIIILTQENEGGAKHLACMQAGAKCYLTKPFSVDKLEKALVNIK